MVLINTNNNNKGQLGWTSGVDFGVRQVIHLLLMFICHNFKMLEFQYEFRYAALELKSIFVKDKSSTNLVLIGHCMNALRDCMTDI